MAWHSAVNSHFTDTKMKDACMYTLYHMLSFILFIVPIFLIYLLPHLSPNTSSCSSRLCAAGYQKGVGKTTPQWLGAQRASTAVCALPHPDELHRRGAAGRVEGHLGVSVFELWLLINLRCAVMWARWAQLCVPALCSAGRAALLGWSWQCLTTQGCLTAEIKGNGPLGVWCEHLFWLRTSC